MRKGFTPSNSEVPAGWYRLPDNRKSKAGDKAYNHVRHRFEPISDSCIGYEAEFFDILIREENHANCPTKC